MTELALRGFQFTQAHSQEYARQPDPWVAPDFLIRQVLNDALNDTDVTLQGVVPASKRFQQTGE